MEACLSRKRVRCVRARGRKKPEIDMDQVKELHAKLGAIGG